LETYSSPAEALTQGLKCKTNTIPILMPPDVQDEKVGNPKKEM
jgi:hypothetical protein